MTDEVLLALCTSIASGTGAGIVATTGTGIRALVDRIRQRFSGDDGANGALDDVIDAPTDIDESDERIHRLIAYLRDAAGTDADFVESLEEFHRNGVIINSTGNTTINNSAENVKLAVQGEQITGNTFTVN